MILNGKLITLTITSLLIIASSHAFEFAWPNSAKAAVSLSYDDALNSQLDHAIPALDRYNFKGSFYLTLSSPTVASRLNEWRTIAQNGHELGNHSINHACRGSLPNREWVPEHNDLDKKFYAEVVQEIKTANTFLQAIDGETIRTFTVPCADQIVENKNYINAIKDSFIGIKSHIGKMPKNMAEFSAKNAPFIAPHDISGEALIKHVENARDKGTIVNLTFHGIGGDHLSVSKEAHQMLLDYLHNHRSDYWVGTYREISLYIASKH